jgi:hypothetical protein
LRPESTALICQHLLQSRTLAKGGVVLGVSAVAIAVAGCLISRVRVAGLCREVDLLNEEIGAFLARGGCLSGIRGIEAILDRSHVGIGHGLNAEMQTDEQAASCEARAVWDPVVQRLVMRVDGGAGARSFDFDAVSGDRVAA